MIREIGTATANLREGHGPSPSPLSRCRVASPRMMSWGVQQMGIMLVWLMGVDALGASIGSWTWLNPTPHGANVVDLARFGSRYLQVGESGQIFSSTNRVSWEPVASGTTLELRGVAVLGSRWVVVGENGLTLWSDESLAFQPGTGMPPTGRWLEAVAASSSMAVAVGDAGAIYWTTNGVDWAAADGVPVQAWLRGVAFGGDSFVAVGESGTLLTSTDGRQWIARPLGISTDLNRVVHGMNRFVAVGDSGEVLVSTNGNSWVRQRLPVGQNPNLYTAVSTTHGIVVAGETSLYFRPDLSPGWQNHVLETTSPAPAPEWTYSAAIWDGEEVVLCGQTGVSVVGRPVSTLPTVVWAWFRTDESSRSGIWDIERFDRLYLGVGEVSTVLSSVSGGSMDLEGLPGDYDGVIYGVGGSTNVALAVGAGGAVWRSVEAKRIGTVTNQLVIDGTRHDWVTSHPVSLLGVEWEPVAGGLTSEALQGVGWNGRQYVIVGARGTVLRSPDGAEWRKGQLPTLDFYSSVAAASTEWVAVGRGGALAFSSDAEIWEQVATGVSDWIYRVRWDGMRWMAVGQGGILLESTNGRTWERRETGTSAWLTDVRRVGEDYFVCGTQGLLMRSRDRLRWEQVETPTGKPFYAMATRGEELVLSGAEGVVLKLLLNEVIRPVEVAQYELRTEAQGVLELIRFEGLAGRAFQLETSSTLREWGRTHDGRLGSTGGALYGRRAAEPVQFHRARAVP